MLWKKGKNMTKLKQKITEKFQNNQNFNVQNWLELWSKDTVDNFVNNFIDFQDKTTKVFKQDFFSKTKHFADAYYAQRAVQFEADEDLPFKTLVLLGQKLNHPAYKEEVQKIIKDNIIKIKGVYYKLDDLDQQKKIQSAIKNYQFDECQPLNKAA